MMGAKTPPRAVLFDLDGTLIDSAPDLAGAANTLRAEHGLEPLPYEQLRPMVGAGARGLVGVAFGVAPGDERFELLRDAFLARYERSMLDRTRIFEGIEDLLAGLEAAGIAWGIVTNKATRFALPVAQGVGLVPRAGALVCGDTTAHSKPHPEPLWEAARRLGHMPADCLYVGDDLRDVQAGRAAGMATLVAAWGYLGQGEPIHAWGADAIVESPPGLLKWLQLD